ncbi:hypothetical protein CF166_17535 [Amycolatopsis sp. KNN50.9b]|nr:hypothetical protein CF166_17535 [Amycolatopsis sp. KNN50.9b]
MPVLSRRHLRPAVIAVTAIAALSAPAASAVTGAATTSPFVVKLTNSAGACSGVLVDPQWILTSSTCFPDTTGTGAPSLDTTAIIGRSDLAGTDGHTIAITSVVPQTGRPVVMARLASPVTDVTTAAISGTAPQGGDTIQVAGYGRTATEWVPNQPHSAAVTVDATTATTLTVSSSTGPTTCKGDAGGPAFRQNSGQSELLALNHASWQGGCLGETETRTSATETRVDDLRDSLTAQMSSAILARYLELGGTASFLGNPSGAEYAVADGTGQDYEHGSIYYSPATGAHYIQGPILEHYRALGGPAALGFPTTDENTTPDGIGRYNHFNLPSGASIYWSPATGAHEIQGAIRDKWATMGWETKLGYPTTGELGTSDGARYNDFSHPDGASIYWTSTTGAHEIQGLIRDKWLAIGAGPRLGYPVTDESITPDGVGHYNHFSLADGASIYWTPATGAHSIQGAIRDRWAALGWETGPGYPTTDESTTPDTIGRYNHFTNNTSIYWSPSTGAHAVVGTIRDTWASLGWETSRLGYPASDEYGIAGGRRSDFQHGYITWNASNNTTQVIYT